MLTIVTKDTFDWDDLDDFFWSGARDRWVDATDEQKQEAFDRLCEYAEDGEIDAGQANDIVWFECDDIFFPEEHADESCKRRRARKALEIKRR